MLPQFSQIFKHFMMESTLGKNSWKTSPIQEKRAKEWGRLSTWLVILMTDVQYRQDKVTEVLVRLPTQWVQGSLHPASLMSFFLWGEAPSPPLQEIFFRTFWAPTFYTETISSCCDSFMTVFVWLLSRGHAALATRVLVHLCNWPTAGLDQIHLVS